MSINSLITCRWAFNVKGTNRKKDRWSLVSPPVHRGVCVVSTISIAAVKVPKATSSKAPVPSVSCLIPASSSSKSAGVSSCRRLTVVASAEPPGEPLGAPPAVALVLVLVRQALQPRRHFLFGLHQNVQKVLRDVSILIVKEGRCQTEVSHSPSPSDSVDVLLNVAGQVKVYHVFDVGDV